MLSRRFRGKLFLQVLMIFIFLNPFVLNAQESEAVEETVSRTQEETEEANEIRQPFKWNSAGDVSKYKIIIRHKVPETQKWEICYEHETDESETEKCLIYFDPPLEEGRYRSEIHVFNIFDMPEEDLTSYDEFDVYKAYKPRIKNVSYPLYMRSVIYLDDLDNNGIIDIEGANLFDTGRTQYYLQNSARKIRPEKILSHDEKNRSLRLGFSMKDLEVGVYNFVAKDISGLHSEFDSSSQFIIKFKKLVDFDVEFGYTVPIVLHDDTISDYLSQTVFPLSAQARMTFIPFKRRWGYLGLGLRAQYSRFEGEFENYTVDGNFGFGHALIVYQVPTPRRHWYFELHAGGGVTYFNNMVFHFSHDIDSEPLNTLSLSFDAGANIMLYPFRKLKRFYFEGGADYILTLNEDMTMGTIQPSLGIGWQF